MDLDEFIDSIKDSVNGNKSFGKIDQSILETVKKEIKVKLPDEYEQFLLLFGSGMVGYFEFYGCREGLDVFLETPPNILYINKKLWKMKMNDNLLAIAYAGDQEYFVIDCSVDSKKYGSVYIWNPSLMDEHIDDLEVISNSFLDFLDKAYNEEL